jgi:diaminopimelate epimerase
MKQIFYKYEGTGNDFIIIDNRDGNYPSSDVLTCRKLCARRFGIGADGLILLQNMTGYDFEMLYFNADGNESTMCGNGGRCIAHFAKTLGITKNNETNFIAIDGEHKAVSGENNIVKLKMRDVKDITGFPGPPHHFTLNTGSPHYVTVVKDVMGMDVVKEGRKVRYSKDFANEGINVNFIQLNSSGLPFLRTYERGVENETLSCGTGTVATALCLKWQHLLDAQDCCEIMTMGGKLKVWYKQNEGNGKFRNIWLEGPVKMVYKGEIEI